MSITIDLSGEVALVTGGGSGIGEAIAIKLARAGAAVAVADLSEESASCVGGAINEGGGEALPVRVDIGDPASIEAGIALVHAEFGPVSILVNNAAAWVVKEFKETTPAEVERVVGVTLIGTINVTRAALPDVPSSAAGRRHRRDHRARQNRRPSSVDAGGNARSQRRPRGGRRRAIVRRPRPRRPRRR